MTTAGAECRPAGRALSRRRRRSGSTAGCAGSGTRCIRGRGCATACRVSARAGCWPGNRNSSQIVAAAKASFLHGADWGYSAGISAILIGALLVFFLVPNKSAEERFLADYHTEDTTGTHG